MLDCLLEGGRDVPFSSVPCTILGWSIFLLPPQTRPVGISHLLVDVTLFVPLGACSCFVSGSTRLGRLPVTFAFALHSLSDLSSPGDEIYVGFFPWPIYAGHGQRHSPVDSLDKCQLLAEASQSIRRVTPPTGKVVTESSNVVPPGRCLTSWQMLGKWFFFAVTWPLCYDPRKFIN